MIKRMWKLEKLQVNSGNYRRLNVFNLLENRCKLSFLFSYNCDSDVDICKAIFSI